jgi:hypothetical protein
MAAAVALTVATAAANAKGHHDNNGENGKVPQFAISGQSVNVKGNLRGKKNDKHAERKKKKDCKHVTVPTPECGVGAHDPVGNTHPAGTTASTGSGTKTPSPAYTTVTLSNGVTNSAIFNGKGLTITSSSPGTITVSNGNSSVTLPGGSLTLHGAISVSASSGLQLVHLTNGDVTVAVSPILVSGPAKPGTNNVPPGVTFGDDLKSVGKTFAKGVTLGTASTVIVPAAAVTTAFGGIVATVQGHPIKGTEEIAGAIADEAGSALSWVGGWF